MTVAAVEGGEAAAGESSASASSAAGRGRSAGPAAAGAAGVSPTRKRRPQQDSRARDFASKAGKPGKLGRGDYQPVILVEFLAAILLTAATPVATGKSKEGLSPYAGADIVKLSALTLVYLILAMISVGGRTAGRVAAWIGGLILLTDGLYEASNIVKDLQLLGGGGTAAGTVANPGPSPAPGGTGFPTPTGDLPPPQQITHPAGG